MRKKLQAKMSPPGAETIIITYAEAKQVQQVPHSVPVLA